MKRIVSIIGVLIIGLLIWYLFIKPYDYVVTFKAKTSMGTINQALKAWNSTLEPIPTIQQENLNNLKQQMEFNDSIYSYEWYIKSINDSTSKVKVYVKDLNHSLQNKFWIPFGYTDFEKRTISTVTDFNKTLNEHIKKFKVHSFEKTEIPTTYCAYIPIKAKQIDKAKGMMQNYSLLSSVLVGNNVKLNGSPFVEIKHWDMTNDSIHYNFCYPIIKSDSLPESKILKYKQFEGAKALKVIYNGNYITSDRAWYALMDYARENNIEVHHSPIEIFHSNPNLGSDELKWKAEIYMPLKN